jgi:rod shape-determining protein MreD
VAVSQIVWTRLDGAARGLAPFAFTVMLIMLGMVPLGIPNFAPVVPALGMIAVFFWLVHRPELMPAWAVFLVGLIQDLLGGGALGVGVFVLLVVYAALVGQRRYLARANFFVVWLAFMPVAAGAFVLTWLFNSLIADALLAPEPAVYQYLSTVAFYPVVAWLFVQAQRAFLR